MASRTMRIMRPWARATFSPPRSPRFSPRNFRPRNIQDPVPRNILAVPSAHDAHDAPHAPRNFLHASFPPFFRCFRPLRNIRGPVPRNILAVPSAHHAHDAPHADGRSQPNPLPPSLRGKGGRSRPVCSPPRCRPGPPRAAQGRPAPPSRGGAGGGVFEPPRNIFDFPSAHHAHDAPHAPRNILHTSLPQVSPAKFPAAQYPGPVSAQHLARSLPRTMRTMRLRPTADSR
jgi:hypothetical protein